MYLPFQNVHTPQQAPESYINQYKSIQNMQRRVLAGTIMYLSKQTCKHIAEEFCFHLHFFAFYFISTDQCPYQTYMQLSVHRCCLLFNASTNMLLPIVCSCCTAFCVSGFNSLFYIDKTPASGILYHCEHIFQLRLPY